MGGLSVISHAYLLLDKSWQLIRLLLNVHLLLLEFTLCLTPIFIILHLVLQLTAWYLVGEKSGNQSLGPESVLASQVGMRIRVQFPDAVFDFRLKLWQVYINHTKLAIVEIFLLQIKY
jgi:hypothetical protein